MFFHYDLVSVYGADAALFRVKYGYLKSRKDIKNKLRNKK